MQIVDNQGHQNDHNMPNDCRQQNLAAIGESQQETVLKLRSDAPVVGDTVANGNQLEGIFWNHS